MELLPAELPPPYSQENIGMSQKQVYTKFFSPYSNWTWFVTKDHPRVMISCERALVIQNDVSNQYSSITIFAAITSKFDEPPYPTEVVIEPADSSLPQRSAVVLNQIRSIDRQRLVKKLGGLRAPTMR